MSVKQLLLLFILFPFLTIAQVPELTEVWQQENNERFKYFFRENGTVITHEYKTIGNKLTSWEHNFKKIDNKIYLSEKGKSNEGTTFETLTILNERPNILEISRSSRGDTSIFLNAKGVIPAPKANWILRYPDIDFKMQGADEPHIIKRKIEAFFKVDDRYFKKRRYPPYFQFSFATIGSRFDDFYNTYRLKPTRVTEDSVYFHDLQKDSVLIVTKSFDTNLTTDSLMGTWIILQSKSKFDRSYSKTSKTVYINHDQLTILPNNRCEYLSKTEKSSGIIYHEKIWDLNYIGFYGFTNDFAIAKQIEVVDKNHLILHPFNDESGNPLTDNIPDHLSAPTLYLIKLD